MRDMIGERATRRLRRFVTTLAVISAFMAGNSLAHQRPVTLYYGLQSMVLLCVAIVI